MNNDKRIIITLLCMLFMQNTTSSFSFDTKSSYAKWTIAFLAGVGLTYLLRGKSSILRSYWHKYQMTKFTEAAGKGDLDSVKKFLARGYNPFEALWKLRSIEFAAE